MTAKKPMIVAMAGMLLSLMLGLGGVSPASLSFVGWAVGEGGTILHTSDGGITWFQQTSTISGPLHGVAFVDARNGWAVEGSYGLGASLHTNNRGSTWSPQTRIKQLFLYGLVFRVAPNGVVVLHDRSG